MQKASTRELILLLLHHYQGEGEKNGNGLSPYEVSTTGITDVLEISQENMSERMKLISTLSDMKQEGLIEEKVGRVEGFDDERNVYFLTEEGEKYAEDVHDRMVGQEITVRDETGEYEAKLGEVAGEIPEPGLVRTLAKTGNGVLDLRESGVGDWFIDRDEELDLLHNELVKVKRSGSRTVLVSGETGVGKTALLSRFEDVAIEKGFEFVEGRCPKGVSDPYHWFRNAFDKYLESHDLSLLDQETPIVDEEDEVEAQKRALFHEVAEFITEISNSLVVFIDDLHWIDRESLELFDFLIENVEDHVLFVGSYRPEDVSGELDFVKDIEDSVGESNYLHIELDNFVLDETRGVIEWLVESQDIPDEFVELVHEKTGGNPLFIRESVKEMIEKDVVLPDQKVFPSEDYEIPVPDEIEETIERRLRSLDRRALEIVETCAVIGDEIRFELLDEVLEIEEHDLRDYLDVLRDTKIVSTGREEVFEFVNSVTRDTVLENLSEEEKRRLHRRVGEAIEKLSEEEEWEEYERIGYHYDHAGEYEDALEYYLEAADRAKSTYALEKALESYERGLEIARELGDEETELSVLIEIGHTHYLASEYDEADKQFEYVWQQAEDDEVLMRVSRYQARMRVNRGEHEEGIEVADRGLSEWDGKTPSKEARSLLSSKGWAVQEQGKLEEASEIYEKELEIAHELGDDEDIGVALHDLGSLHIYRNELDEAEEVLKESIERLEKSDSKHLLSSSVNTLGITYWKMGSLEKSRETLERSLEICEEIGDKIGISKSLLNLGLISDVIGDWEGGLEYYEEAFEIARNTEDRGTVANVSGNLGLMYLDMGQPDRALEQFERALELGRELGIKRTEINTLSSLSRYYHITNDIDSSLAQAEKALELAEETGGKYKRLVALDSLGRAELGQVNLDKAREYHEEAVELSEGTEDTDRVDTRCGLVEVYLELGRIDDAYDVAKEAVEIAEDISDFRRKLRSERAMGMVLREKGEYEEAEEELKSALERARKPGSKYDECQTLHQLGLLEKKRGNDERAAEYFEKGKRLAEDCGFERYRERFQEVRGES